MIGMCQYGFGLKWCNVFFRLLNGVMVNQYFLNIQYVEMVKSLYGVMVIWWNFPMVNHFFGTYFHQWWDDEEVKYNFRVGVNCFVGVNFVPRDIFLGDNCCRRKFCLPRTLYRGVVPGVFYPGDNSWQHLTHYWDTISPVDVLG